jgi:hypothetical protein
MSGYFLDGAQWNAGTAHLCEAGAPHRMGGCAVELKGGESLGKN